MDSNGDAGRSCGHIRKALQIKANEKTELMHLPYDSAFQARIFF